MPTASPPELVILVSLDTLRADRLGCYGYPRDTSPNLDALASDGVLYATAAAQATQTLISHKSLFTAKYPMRLARETTNADLERLAAVEHAKEYIVGTFQGLDGGTLLDRLRGQGYRTAAFTDNIWVGRQMGFDRGFDDFDETGGHLEAIVPRALGWLLRHREGRRFLFLHTYDTHCPYWCREPYNSMFCKDHSSHLSLEDSCGKTDLMGMDLDQDNLRAISDHYDAGIAGADAYLGELFRRLRELSLYDEALIVVTSDHGESLGTHGQIGHGGLFLEQLMVPLIIKFPSSWSEGSKVVEDPVELVDVMPTILDAGGIGIPPDVDGRSLIAADQSPRRYLVAQMAYREGPELLSNPAKRALLEPGRWLLIHDARNDRIELFDLGKDPAGMTAVALEVLPGAPAGATAETPAVLPELIAALAARDAGRSMDEFVEPVVEIDEETRRALESLGYVGP